MSDAWLSTRRRRVLWQPPESIPDGKAFHHEGRYRLAHDISALPVGAAAWCRRPGHQMVPSAALTVFSADQERDKLAGV